MNKRLSYFDIARGAGMVLVLIGHLQGEILGYSPYILYLCIWIFSFHMPLFFIISGMLIRYKNDRAKDFKDLVKRRFKGIMIPYYWFSLIYIGIVLWGLFIDKIVPPSTLFINIWYVIGLYGMNVLWFLPAAFLGEVLFLYIFKRLDDKKAVAAVIILTAIAYVLNLLLQQGTYDTAVMERFHELCITILRPVFACSFITIGYYGFGLMKKLRNEGFSFMELALSLCFLAVNIVCIVISMKVLHYNNVGEFRSLVHNNVIVYYAAALSGSAWLIILSKNLSKLRYAFPLLTLYGVNSLVFMAVHNNSKVLTFALRTAMYVNQYLTRARGYICYGIIVLTMLIYTTLMILFINRFFPFLGGKPYKKKAV
ncbi:MAG: acyltransferase family protein [Lachnospiraceae bacterium]|nr:acyltransferase family protein [Lachnospiraceae bacterium]